MRALQIQIRFEPVFLIIKEHYADEHLTMQTSEFFAFDEQLIKKYAGVKLKITT